jgi:AraC-like DNA-binding protein
MVSRDDAPYSDGKRVSLLIDIEDEPPTARLDYFRHALASSIAPYDLRVEAEGALRGASIHAGQVAAVGVTRVVGPERFDCRRTPKLIRGSDPELFKIDVQVRGRTAFSQGDREVALAPGDFTLVDLSRPSHVRNAGGGQEIVAVAFPHDALPLRHDELARVTAVRVPGRDGLGAPIVALARHLARRLDDCRATDGARLSGALMDLLIVALAERLDRIGEVARSTRRRALMTSVQAFIERRLADPRLSPGTIAGEHHISPRLLHKLFEEQGTSVGRWIRERRLERCRRDLLDPALDDLPASAIAFQWGFAGASHFSRVFREAYGQPPGEYRRIRREEPGPVV